MVDIGSKSCTQRTATAQGQVRVGDEIARLISENTIKKGDVICTAQIAGVMAAKLTAQLIPLCHQINLTNCKISIENHVERGLLTVTADCSCNDRTGVEMEAMVACSVACLTVYDMCKALSKEITIENVRLLAKKGGKSKDFRKV